MGPAAGLGPVNGVGECVVSLGVSQINLGSVGFTAMFDTVDVNDACFVINSVKNTVVVDTDAVAFVTGQFNGAMRARIGC